MKRVGIKTVFCNKCGDRMFYLGRLAFVNHYKCLRCNTEKQLPLNAKAKRLLQMAWERHEQKLSTFNQLLNSLKGE